MLGGLGVWLMVVASGCAGKNTGPAVDEPKGPLGVAPIEITWGYKNTVQTYNIYGYNIYRSENRTGEFQKINDDLIVPSPDNPNPEFVVYLDKGLPLMQEFYYYVEAVLQNGERKKATAVYPLRVSREMTPEETKEWRAERARQAKKAGKAKKEQEEKK